MLGRARARVAQKAPYWSAALYGFVYVPVPGCNTMFVTENGVLGYDPAFVESQSKADLSCALAHEVAHFLLEHSRRKGERDAGNWNRAADLAVNDLLLRATWDVPVWFLRPEQFGFPDKLSAEKYYELLNRPANRPTGRGVGAESENRKQHTGSGESDGADAGESENPDSPPSGPGTGHGCGGIAGCPRDGDLERALDKQHGRADADQIRNEVAHAIQEHVRSRGRDSLPGDLFEWAAAATDRPNMIRWEHELEALLQDGVGRIRSGGSDYSWRRPSRRSFTRGILRPGLVDHLPEVAFVIDTSGSMSAPQLGRAVGEAARILRALELDEVWLGQADTRLVEPFARAALADLQGNVAIKGRGGTDFRPVLGLAGKLDPPPDLLVYFTDGDGDAPDKAPEFSVVWCVIQASSKPAAWGHTVFID